MDAANQTVLAAIERLERLIAELEEFDADPRSRAEIRADMKKIAKKMRGAMLQHR